MIEKSQTQIKIKIPCPYKKQGTYIRLFIIIIFTSW